MPTDSFPGFIRGCCRPRCNVAGPFLEEEADTLSRCLHRSPSPFQHAVLSRCATDRLEPPIQHHLFGFSARDVERFGSVGTKSEVAGLGTYSFSGVSSISGPSCGWGWLSCSSTGWLWSGSSVTDDSWGEF